MRTYEKISLQRVARHLGFTDTFELEEWLLTIPKDYGIKINGEIVVFTQDLRSDTAEAEAAIEELKNKFQKFKQSDRRRKA
ncbi:MAG: hypothetical protein GF308_08405 [Candidatus Heimdallarchaeota archaeon]|nr:hypothetical protein [Candidatus Heimdallarchaeota archaeon]